MKKTIVILLLFCCAQIFAQSTTSSAKPKNLIVVLMDGYRWKELFGGADSMLLFDKKYTSQDSLWLMKKYWANDAVTRREKLMPFVWGTIAKQGVLMGNRNLGNEVYVKNKYWFSYPGRSETFCGYYDSAVNSNEYPDNPNENVFEFINKQQGYNNKVVTFASWNALGRIFNRNRNKMLVNLYGEDVTGNNLTPLQKEMNTMQHYITDIFGNSERPDAMTYIMAKAYMMAEHPQVLYFDLGDTDEFAHEGHYDLYLDAAYKTDMMLKELWDYIQQDSFYKDQTTLLLIADHGRGYNSEWTSHGSEIMHSNETYFVGMGTGIPALGEVNTKETIYQEAFAQTFANLLGLKFTANHPVADAFIIK
ncbi:MAG TPA: hypothetical protein VFW07_25870 [Parafilimonas sp.]|nr:hypothetical protein [Parafilimonas sp.]